MFKTEVKQHIMYVVEKNRTQPLFFFQNRAMTFQILLSILLSLQYNTLLSRSDTDLESNQSITLGVYKSALFDYIYLIIILLLPKGQKL